MSEWDKMVSGQLYNAELEDLPERRTRCKQLCHTLNQLPPDQKEKRTALFRQLFGRTGERFHIEPSFWCDYGENIFLGEDFYANHNLVILDCAPVTFGEHVFIAPNCGIYTARHPLCSDERNQGLEQALPVTIGDDVWIGADVTILPGITIGTGAVIGAKSLVTRDVPPHTLAMGHPCRNVRPIRESDRIRKDPDPQ